MKALAVALLGVALWAQAASSPDKLTSVAPPKPLAAEPEVWKLEAKPDLKAFHCDPGYENLLAFQHTDQARFWICGSPDSGFRKVGTAHWRMNNGFTAWLEASTGKTRVFDEGEMMSRPLDIEAKSGELLFRRSFVLQKPGKGNDRTYLVPYEARALSCRAGAIDPARARGVMIARCFVASPSCIYEQPDWIPKTTLADFDAAVKNFKTLPEGADLVSSEVFKQIDAVFLLSISGDLSAEKRIRDFPLEVDGGAAEIIATLSEFLTDGKAAGCPRHRK